MKEVEDLWLLYHPASSSHRLSSLHALGCMYSTFRQCNNSYGNEAETRNTEQSDKRWCHLSDLCFWSDQRV